MLRLNISILDGMLTGLVPCLLPCDWIRWMPVKPLSIINKPWPFRRPGFSLESRRSCRCFEFSVAYVSRLAQRFRGRGGQVLASGACTAQRIL